MADEKRYTILRGRFNVGTALEPVWRTAGQEITLPKADGDRHVKTGDLAPVPVVDRAPADEPAAAANKAKSEPDPWGLPKTLVPSGDDRTEAVPVPGTDKTVQVGDLLKAAWEDAGKPTVADWNGLGEAEIQSRLEHQLKTLGEGE